MKIEAKKIRIEFGNSSEDYWEASCESGLELDEAIRMITRAWEEHDASAEPLIKDEEIREIVRPWAKVNGATELKYYEGENCLEDVFRNEIHFNQALGLEDAKTYTIAELCGTPEPIEPIFIDLDERIKGKEGE